MQALIDFEGWRKWRGFMDSSRSASPGFDGAASPMQGSNHHRSPSQTQPASPSLTRTASKQNHHKLQRPNLPDAREILREDSWGSGSGGDTADSSSPPVAPPAGQSSEESDAPTQ